MDRDCLHIHICVCLQRDMGYKLSHLRLGDSTIENTGERDESCAKLKLGM
jgi:hypothetical protein